MNKGNIKSRVQLILIPAVITLFLHGMVFLVFSKYGVSLVELLESKSFKSEIQLMELEDLSDLNTDETKMAAANLRTENQVNVANNEKPVPAPTPNINNVNEADTTSDSLKTAVLSEADGNEDSLGSTGDTIDFWSIYNSGGFGNQNKDGSDGTGWFKGSMPKFMGSNPMTSFNIWVVNKFVIPNGVSRDYNERFTINFIIDENGDIKNITIVDCSNETIKNEMIKVLKESPRWTPAQNAGHNVVVNYTMPVTIKNSR